MNQNKSDYIDERDALNRIGGKLDLYQTLLLRFVEGNQLDKLESALELGNISEALRIAHTIKGVAANLSLIKLAAASKQLELLIKDELDYLPKLDELKQIYGQTEQIILRDYCSR